MTSKTRSPQAVPPTLDQALQQAIAHHKAGQLQDAERLYRAILQAEPNHPDANHNLGVLAAQLGQYAAALPYLNVALAISPAQGQYSLSYAEALLAAGQAIKALSVMQAAIQRGLNTAAAHALRAKAETATRSEFSLTKSPKAGKATIKKRTPKKNKRPSSRSAALTPSLPQTEVNQLVALFNAGRHAELENRARLLLGQYPDSGFAWKALGFSLGMQGKDALPALQKATKLLPDDADAYNNLGNALQDLGQLDDAVASYRRALQIKPDFAQAHNNLGNALKDLGQLDDAVANYRRALQINPDFVEAHNNLGNALKDLGQLDDAMASCRRALEINPDYAEAHNNLGNALQDLGQLDAAVAIYRRALQIKPDNAGAHSNLLFIHNYLSDQPAAVLLAEARRFGDLAARQALPYTDWSNIPEFGRCLRVGLVSGDFRNHPIGYFFEGVLAALASSAVARLELIAYSNSVSADRVTQRIKASCQGWHSAVGLSDERLAQRIRDDGIDILIDLSGHTAHNRLPLFAWKPAPVQASWLGYFATTGVTAMDYLIADPWTVPETNEEAQFTETIWRLPESYLCFTPPDIDVKVEPLPALANGHITFGCFNNLTKMNDAVVALWARVLLAVPKSRLLLITKQLDNATVRKTVVERFAAYGVSAGRLTMERNAPRAELLAAYQRVDIALDPFPYPGGTTSVEGLWMGVPVLTLTGDRFLSHIGESILQNAGLPEWIATDADDYVARAVAHAGDLHRLASLRKELRQQVLASPLFDAPRFAHHFEAALRGMWKKWCTQQTKPNTAMQARLNVSSARAMVQEVVTTSTAFTSDKKALPQTKIDQLVALFNDGCHAEMENLARLLLGQYPDSGFAWKALAVSLRTQGKDALPALQKATRLLPDDAEAHSNLGNALQDLGQLDGAAASYRRALQIKPDFAEAHSNLCNALQALGQLDDAMASCRRALLIKPDFAEAHNNLGGALQDLGQLDNAVASYRRALLIKPEFAGAHSNLLFIHNYLSDQPAAVLLDEARRFGDLVARQAHPYTDWHNVPDSDRCLRVGLVSGDFRNHSVGHFIEGVLAALASDVAGRLKLFAYPNSVRADEVTQRIKACCQGWHSTVGLSDEVLAQRIRDDSIDILIDLSGHTAHNRLPLFAWKPVPVQATWLGYFATTGVAAMDYLIADPWTVRETEEAHFTEKIWRLPETYLCLTPPDIDVHVGPLPALANGHITFGCFNHLTKMNDAVVALWARVLLAVPGSRLFLIAKQLGEATVRESTVSRFAVHGIEAGRLILKGAMPRAELLAAYHRVDIALDPFPYPGGTTSVEGLWMGVPVLTLTGDRFLSHIGESILQNAGLPEWIATDADDYVARAVAHAGDLHRLASLRKELRQQVLASPLFDAPRFAHHFEAALRGMWKKWCTQQTKPNTAMQSRLDTSSARAIGQEIDATSTASTSDKKALPQTEIDHLIALFNAGHHAELESRARLLLEQYPDFGFAWKALAVSLRTQGKDAMPALQKATRLLPDDAEAHRTLGNALKDIGQLDDAVANYRRALQLEPDFAEAHNNLGLVLQDLGQLDDAAASYRRALEINPDFAQAHNNLGFVLQDLGQLDDAVASYRRALQIKPDYAEAHNNLGNSLQDLGQLDDAVASYRQALRIKPDALQHSIHAQLLLPRIPDTTDAIDTWRKRYQKGIAALMAEPGTLEQPGIKANLSSFYLAYQNCNDKTAMEALCDLFRARLPALTTTPRVPGWQPPATRDERIRVGFLSNFLVGHTIGKLYQGFIHHLDRSRFQVVVIHTLEAKRDGFRQHLDTLADEVITLPIRLEGQQQAVIAARLDALFYPDIGMAPSTYFLAYARLAPVQAVGWGHPDTTGLDTMDYFVSAAPIEPEGAEEHYTERLIRLNRIPCYYEPLLAPTQIPDRVTLGLPEIGTLYGCPQSLFKFHPDFDGVLAAIAEGDPMGRIVLLEGRYSSWSTQMKARWAKTAPLLLDRVLFLPQMPLDRFMALIAHMDVLLDPIHFGSGNTLYEAMVYGIPVVTWPGQFMRGRIVAGAYQQMGIVDAPIARCLEDYVAVALALGRDPKRRQTLRQESLAAANRELFADMQTVREFELFLEAAVAAAGRGEKLPAGWKPNIEVWQNQQGNST